MRPETGELLVTLRSENGRWQVYRGSVWLFRSFGTVVFHFFPSTITKSRELSIPESGPWRCCGECKRRAGQAEAKMRHRSVESPSTSLHLAPQKALTRLSVGSQADRQQGTVSLYACPRWSPALVANFRVHLVN